MKEEYETYAYFWVSGFENPHSEISDLLGLAPTKAWQRGEQREYIPKQKESGWEFHSPLQKNEIFMDAHISALLEILEPKKIEIAKLQNEYEIGINCVGYFRCTNPGFHLDSQLIKKCAELNLSIDFDLYCTEEAT